MADLPDYYTQIVAEEAEAYAIRGGADASKSASPSGRDVYLATDTEKIYFCCTVGSWSDFLAAHAALTTGVHGVGAGAIVGTTLTQTLTNKTLTSPDINAGTVDAITSLTVANDIDIGSYNLRAKTLQSDVATGTAPLIVASTTAVTNLNADLLDAKHYSDISSEIDTDVATHAALTATHGATGAIVGTTNTQTLTNKTLTSPTINGTIATTGLTMPAFTLGGNITATNRNITGLAAITLADGATIRSAADDDFIYLLGAVTAAKAAIIRLSGSDHASMGRIDVSTPNAAADAQVDRLVITGKVAVAQAQWLNIIHTGLKLGGALDVNSNLINSVTDPAAAQDAATKAYVDARAATKEFFIPVTGGTDIRVSSHFVYARLDATGEVATHAFRIPADFTTLTSAVMIVIPKLTIATANWDIYSVYAANGESITTHSESDEASTYDATADEYFEVDISGILSSLAAGDRGCIEMVLGAANSAVDVIGISIKYS